VTRPVSLPPPSPKQETAPPRPHLQRLSYHIDTARGNGTIDVVNQEQFAWSDVSVEVGEGYKWFNCPTLPAVERGHILVIESRGCRSSDGHVPTHVCIVRVAAEQGRITSGLEPCVPVK
jgi:hypothetical protein